MHEARRNYWRGEKRTLEQGQSGDEYVVPPAFVCIPRVGKKVDIALLVEAKAGWQKCPPSTATCAARLSAMDPILGQDLNRDMGGIGGILAEALLKLHNGFCKLHRYLSHVRRDPCTSARDAFK